MKKPNNPEIAPKGDWTIIFPGTGHRISSNHPSHFLQLCHEHMTINGIPIIGGWQDQMFDLVCQQNPYAECHEVGEKPRTVAGEDIWRFLTTLWEAMAQGAKAVPQEEADRRASICAKCPKMGRVACSFGCGKMAEVLSHLVLGRKSKSLDAVHKANCMVCGCEISSLVNYPLDVLHAVDEKLKFKTEEYPPNCWKLEQPT